MNDKDKTTEKAISNTERNEKFKPIARRYETGKIGFYDALHEAYELAKQQPIASESVAQAAEILEYSEIDCASCKGRGIIVDENCLPCGGTGKRILNPKDVWKFIYSTIAYSLAISDIKQQRQEDAIKNATNQIIAGIKNTSNNYLDKVREVIEAKISKLKEYQEKTIVQICYREYGYGVKVLADLLTQIDKIKK